MTLARPYLIIPKLIEQPTWGGDYIAEMKGWGELEILDGKKIGQSYELFSGTKLAVSITDTSDSRFVPEIGNPDDTNTNQADFKLVEGVDYINIDVPDLLLIKINHSKGNSFQLHIKHGVSDAKWQPKAESWYYLEDGKLTFGIKKGINIKDYKKLCIEIDSYMKNLSEQVVSGQLDILTARRNAKEFVITKNPWQFVNVYTSKKYDIVDPSLGGIHHSWEEDNENFPLGNVVYEIQEDVMDPICTIRAFDQGKIKDDGTIRNINIDDYFKYLDTSEVNNDIERSRSLANSIYAMDVLEVSEKMNLSTDKSYHHIYVRDGAVEISANDINLRVGRGHSAFIPKELKSYIINPMSPNTVVLRTYSTK
jgi:mannose-6-phosphate isomerase class I